MLVEKWVFGGGIILKKFCIFILVGGVSFIEDENFIDVIGDDLVFL